MLVGHQSSVVGMQVQWSIQTNLHVDRVIIKHKINEHLDTLEILSTEAYVDKLITSETLVF